jgi:hypothetical protein
MTQALQKDFGHWRIFTSSAHRLGPRRRTSYGTSKIANLTLF